MTEHTIKRPTLVNFRALPNQLASFDRVCAESGKTRTQVLIEMMQQHVANASAPIPQSNIKKITLRKPLKFDLKPFSRSIGPRAERPPLDTTNLYEKSLKEHSQRIRNRMAAWLEGRKL